MHPISEMRNYVGYPRVYRASIGWRIFLFLCGAGLAAGGLCGSWYVAESTTNAGARPWLIGLCLLFVGLGIYVLLSLFRSRVVLFPDRIEVEELTRTYVLSREEVRGWRLIATSPKTLVLVPNDPARRTVKVALIFRMDTELAEWLDALPCLDLIEQENSEAEIFGDPKLGASRDERASSLSKGRRLSRSINGISMATMLWAFAYPTPYGLVVAAQVALPWVALAIMRRSRGLFRADELPNDAHPSVTVPLILPGAVLLLRSMLDYDFVNLLAVWWCSVGIGALLWWATRSLDPSIRKRAVSSIAFAIFSTVYGLGTALQANTLLDRSPEAEYSVHVEQKRVSSGRVTRYLLGVEPWAAPRSVAAEVQVSRATYEHIERGDVVHLVVRNGALGAAWYYMRAWERGGVNTSGLSADGDKAVSETRGSATDNGPGTTSSR